MSMDGAENFALSYDVENVVKYTNPLQTEYIEAAEALGISYVPQPYKIYRGVSTFNLIETRALDRTVSTWLSSITTETSQFTGSGGCCGGDLYDSAGNLLYAFDDINNPVHIDACMANPDEPNEQDRWWTSKVQPPTTYVLIDVINPLDAWLIFALFGGWLGVLKLGGSYVYISGTKTCCSMKNDDVKPETVVVQLGKINIDTDKTS